MIKRGVVLAAGCLSAFSVVASAQTTKLENEFIFFVDGANVQIPTIAGGSVVADPKNAANKVMKFAGGGWAEQGFQWPGSQGVDVTDFTASNYGETDTLFLRLMVDPINANSGLKLTFFDRTTGLNAGTDDLPFRLNWQIPVWAKDGEWHTLKIPLPLSTVAQLDSAKKGKKVDGTSLGVEVDSLFKMWSYGGAWANGLGVWDASSEHFREYQWNAVYSFGFHYDWNDANIGPVWVDNFYIGSSKTNLAAAAAAPSPVTGITFSSVDKVNKITWPAVAGAGGYNVYFSETAITDIAAATVQQIARLGSDKLSFDHKLYAPHPSLAKGVTGYYAVTPVSDFGAENSNISASSGSYSSDVDFLPWVQEVSVAVGDKILDDLDAGRATGANFPTNIVPFIIDKNSRYADAPGIVDDVDLKIKTWITYQDDAASGSYFFLYSEIVDDVRSWTTVANILSTWEDDGLEMTLGGYQVPSFSQGSTHGAVQRGAEPDYQFRFGKFSDRALGFAFENFRFSSEVPGAQVIVDSLRDAGNAVIGWKMLAVMDIAQFQGGSGSDVFIDLPNNAQLAFYPLTMAYNDADATGARETQLVVSSKPDLSSWYNTPRKWGSAAFAGKDVVSTVSNEDDNAGKASEFTLSQNFPNPFNPSTAIKFSIPAAGDVQLTVFNMLGQKVATLVNGRLAAGSHNVTFDASSLSSGMYLYQLTSGGQTMTRKLMLIK